MKQKSQSDIKLIIESLYDLGIISKRKKRRRKRKLRLIQQQARSSSAHMTGYSETMPTTFHNISNMQSEMLRHNLYQLENEKRILPQLTDLTSRYENENRQLKQGVLYLLDQAHKPESERFYSAPSISRLPSSINSFGDDEEDIPMGNGSESFKSQRVIEPDEETSISNPLSLFRNIFSSPPPKAPVIQNDYQFDGEDEDNIMIPPELKSSSPRATPSKPTRLQERDRLKDVYTQKGGVDANVLFSQSKMEIAGAIKQLDDLNSYKYEYALLGGSDNELKNADLKSLTKLKKEVQKLKRQAKK